ncbi:MAG: QueT transporter family protein [Clostridium sp.]|jgi:uncharacterized membrane protein|nr:QueT transporter family protein [Clostridium sp.]
METQNKTRKTLIYLAQAAIIAALYTALTIAAASVNLAYGAVQFRFSEALTILPALTAAAIPGLTVGCLLSNWIGVSMGLTGPVDILFGTAATLLAAICSYLTRNVKFKGLPWLSSLFPVVFNAVIVGFEITLFFTDEHTLVAFLTNAALVGLGQLVCCVGGGLPLYAALNKSRVFSRLQA